MDTIRPLELLRSVATEYPDAWKQLDLIRANPPEKWASWCWCPLSASFAVMTKGLPIQHIGKDLMFKTGYYQQSCCLESKSKMATVIASESKQIRFWTPFFDGASHLCNAGWR
jgi:hypothetical protein